MGKKERNTGRTDARERALQLLYEATLRSLTVEEILEEQQLDVDPHTKLLMRAAEERQNEIDAFIIERAEGWTLERMATTDLLVLRLGVAELLVGDTIPTNVILAEATDLASRFSTDESGRFVNGVLAGIARIIPERPLS